MTSPVTLRLVDDRPPAPGDTWGTPREAFRELHAEFGFTVDAAALSHNAKPARYWSPREDGLRQPWDGERVWLNPPYSNLEPWLRKAAERRAEVAVLLLPVRTGTDWFLQYVWDPEQNAPRDGVTIRWCRHRVRFEGADTSPAWDSMVVIFRGA